MDSGGAGDTSLRGRECGLSLTHFNGDGNGEEDTSVVCLRTQTHGNSTHQMMIHTHLQVSPYTQLSILIFTSEKQLYRLFEVNIWAGSC